MSPASNSEARKRTETTQPAALADDPVERIRQIARHIHGDGYGALLLMLADEVVPRPPTVSEIIDHLERGGAIELCTLVSGWSPATSAYVTDAEWWRDVRDRAGDDHLAHGYRLVPLTEARTERVPLHELPGRTLPDTDAPVYAIWCRTKGGAQVLLGYDNDWIDLPLNDDGTVEVLIEDDQ